jgi:3-deoxy-D-manno-octulosonate 8-phosphate phosphatase (KDO 8-P phosphatase)
MSAPLRLAVFDVDGVMTDGRFWYSSAGKELKAFGPDDSRGLALLRREVEVVFVSEDHRGFAITRRRIADDMGYPLELVPGPERLDWLRARRPLAEIAYMGDSFVDIPVLRAVGYGIATCDAPAGARAAAAFVTTRRGGDRAVAEACLHVLSHRFGHDELRDLF